MPAGQPVAERRHEPVVHAADHVEPSGCRTPFWLVGLARTSSFPRRSRWQWALGLVGSRTAAVVDADPVLHRQDDASRTRSRFASSPSKTKSYLVRHHRPELVRTEAGTVVRPSGPDVDPAVLVDDLGGKSVEGPECVLDPPRFERAAAAARSPDLAASSLEMPPVSRAERVGVDGQTAEPDDRDCCRRGRGGAGGRRRVGPDRRRRRARFGTLPSWPPIWSSCFWKWSSRRERLMADLAMNSARVPSRRFSASLSDTREL